MMRSAMFGAVALLTVFRFAGYFTEPRLTDAEIHAIAGEPTGVARPPGDHRALTIVTWNIERGARFQNIASTLRALAPDPAAATPRRPHRAARADGRSARLQRPPRKRWRRRPARESIERSDRRSVAPPGGAGRDCRRLQQRVGVSVVPVRRSRARRF